MDEDKSSFLYLPSNVTSQGYVSNTPSQFKIPLAKPLNFRDPHNWEVSLSELYFPSSNYNISHAKCFFSELCKELFTRFPCSWVIR